jgi:hypothetical protein
MDRLMAMIGMACDPNNMPRAAARSIGAHPNLIHVKTSLAKSPSEIQVWSR